MNKRVESFQKLWSVSAFLMLAVGVAGCSSAPKQVVSKDSTLVRYAEAGREAFDEGDIDEAEKKYRRALLRAWAIDDPYESGTVAYNLAAVLTSRRDYAEASDWLTDARVELCRAQASSGNTWLLSAEIAMAQDRFDDADRFVHFASLACPPCEIDGSHCLCGPSGSCCHEECKECCLVRLPLVGPKVLEKSMDRDCRQGYEARVQLTKARLAAKQFDVCGAEKHLALALELSTDVCDLSLQADCHDVAALVHDTKAEFLQAGAHRDREVKLLRCAGLYREIPNVLDAAAESYCSAERLDLAVDRMIRSARIHLARGQLEKAWDRVRDAGEMAECCGCECVKIRLALTAKIIQETLKADSGLEPPQQQSDVGTLAPETLSPETLAPEPPAVPLAEPANF